MEYRVPGTVIRANADVHGAAGVAWAQRLPAAIAACQRQWSLELDQPFANLSYNYVAPAGRADGSAIVLKVCFPDKEFLCEVEALRAFAGRGAVRLLDADIQLGAMLLERVEPGMPLLNITDDDEATSIAASVMRQLWRPVPSDHSFPSVSDWAAGFGRLRSRFAGGVGPFPPTLVSRAETLFAELVASMERPVLLHGDLHHGNILAAQRSPCLAIDPKGVVGEPAYEVGALLRNPLPQLLTQSAPARVLARRINRLADELGFDRARLRDWGFAQAVLAAVWTLEDHGRGWEPQFACVELLAGL
jgi:streptomycin 6-kinase